MPPASRLRNRLGSRRSATQVRSSLGRVGGPSIRQRRDGNVVLSSRRRDLRPVRVSRAQGRMLERARRMQGLAGGFRSVDAPAGTHPVARHRTSFFEGAESIPFVGWIFKYLEGPPRGIRPAQLRVFEPALTGPDFNEEAVRAQNESAFRRSSAVFPTRAGFSGGRRYSISSESSRRRRNR